MTRLVFATTQQVTGDALLTAIHVAKEVEICEPIGGSTRNRLPDKKNPAEIQALLERRNGKKTNEKESSPKSFKPIVFLKVNDDGRLVWCSYDDNSTVAPYEAARMPQMATKYDLATTGACLSQAYEDDADTHKFLESIKVFARMTPVAKETVIESLHSVGTTVMMCGDGANDVSRNDFWIGLVSL
jgi:magnesium-transporting ATPase (P-type)